MERMRLASAVILFPALASWVLALGGLGSINANKCQAVLSNALLTAKCSRVWSWEWWCLFMEVFVILSAAVVTCLPIERLAKGRYVLAHFFSIASVIIMTALSANINTYVWQYLDISPLFSAFDGDDKIMYMSGAALCAGWILLLIFNFAWIAAVLSHGTGAECAKKKESGAPITGAVTGEDNVQVQVRN